MSLTIELTPQGEAWIETESRRQGVPPAEVLRKLVDAQAKPTPESVAIDAEARRIRAREANRNHFYFTATPEEFRRALDEIAEMNKDLPAPRDEAFDRENLYEDRL
jgi:hypothetical protein